MNKNENKMIRMAAGKKVKWYFSWKFPFLHKGIWVFGGHCGTCGKWNWQWCLLEGYGWTYPCAECIKQDEIGVKKG